MADAPRSTLPRCPRLAAPIVLAHGLFGYDRVAVGRLTVTSYFRGIPEYLGAGGNQVVVTRVPAIAGVKSRAMVLGEQIERACPGQAVHIIGHSMGGLDARQLLADPRWQGRILSLTTIGTPHLGSALADYVRSRAGHAFRLMRALKIKHRGFFDLTRRAALAVNRSARADSDVPCFCVAGTPTVDLVCWPLRPFYDVLLDLEGPNDGLVSVTSAVGFGAPLPPWPVDHLRQLNWLSPRSGPSSSAEIRKGYGSIVENLAGLGFAASGPADDVGPATVVEVKPALSRGFGFVLDRRLLALMSRYGRKAHQPTPAEKDEPTGPTSLAGSS